MFPYEEYIPMFAKSNFKINSQSKQILIEQGLSLTTCATLAKFLPVTFLISKR